jgi:hypothetical protein
MRPCKAKSTRMSQIKEDDEHATRKRCLRRPNAIFLVNRVATNIERHPRARTLA